MRIILLSFFSWIYLLAHPVNYTIDLEVIYNENKNEAIIKCISNSRNKCGLHNFHLLDQNNHILKMARFPFLKKETTVTINKKPSRMIFFLRKIPEHTYNVIIE